MNKSIVNLSTEQVLASSQSIESLSTTDILTQINQQDSTVVVAVQKCILIISSVVDECVRAFEKGGRIVYIGAGTSGRLGVLDASECPPTYGVDYGQVIGLIAGGKPALQFAIEGAEDNTQTVINDLDEIGLQANDVVIGISASGRTPYVASGLAYAKSKGACSVAIANVADSEIGAIADYAIEVLTGAEVVAGSTRMKAGTSQKMVLNMITTATMIRLGKVYKGFMVDVQPTNEKLKIRASRILAQLTQINEIEARSILKAANYDLKVALVAQKHHVSHEQAKTLLAAYNGHIVKAIEHREGDCDDS